MEDKIFAELKKELPSVKKDFLLKNFTSYKIGGPAKYFFAAQAPEELAKAGRLAKKLKLPVVVLGGGSNVLISDKGIKALVIRMEISDIEFDSNKVKAGAGISLPKLAYDCAQKGLSGFEWSAGIPGTLGGAIFGNAHAFGTKTSELVESVVALDIKTLKMKTFSNSQCKFSVKDSIFKKNKNLIIVSANLKLKEKTAEDVLAKTKELLEYRRAKHPMNFPSAGSTFVNPQVAKKILKKFPQLSEHEKNGIVPSGYLIEQCGLKGKKQGQAQISEKHCNFIVNTGKATARDVLILMKLARQKVQKSFGIKLEPEVQLLGINLKI